MKHLANICSLVLLSGLAADQALSLEIRLNEQTLVEFPDAQLGAKELGAPDTFIKSLSPFDRAARKQTDKSVSQDEFLSFVAAQTLSWKAEETERFRPILGSIGKKIAPYALNLPARILLVKTTGKEEGDAAYCRNTNVIVLPQRKLTSSSQKQEDTLIHELFHILSRNNPKLRDELYGIAGFKPCPEIELPEPLKSRKITNPDAPTISHYIAVGFGDKTALAVPVLFSRQANYDTASGKTFFDYLTFRLLVIAQEGDRWRPKYLEDKPWLLEVSEAKRFHEQIGRNTGYIIHPEEVLADNFVFLVNDKRDVPSPLILDQMRAFLSKP